MGTQSKSKEKSTTRATETATPTYQSYATPYATGVGDPALQAYNQAISNYLNTGQEGAYNPTQQALWSQVGNQALNQFGTTGPQAQAANQYIQPYLGQGYMNTLNPYFSKQQQYIESALPQEKKAYLQQLKNEFGPAWGTSGKALGAAGESYANWQAANAEKLANIEAQKTQAAQQGMGYSAANAGTYANMVNPFTWGQQAIQWAGQPGEATTEAQKTQQQLALNWANPLLSLATLGYQYPQSTTTEGVQTSKGETAGKSAGMSCCFIMNEAGDFTDAVRKARDFRYKNDLEVAEGYKRMAKWLVPLMQKSPIVKFVVKWTMTHPIAKVAKVRKVNKHQPALYPIGLFWEALWRVYGLAGTDQFKFSFVIKRLARATSM